jgi:hypothetical protein
MIYTYDYDLGYLPAMPMVTLRIGRPDSTATLVLSRLVDSGADATMIPISYLQEVRAIKRRYVRIRTVSGQLAGASLYTVSLQFAHYRRNWIEVVGNQETDEVIIGRDILNHLVVTLDGLANAVLVQS